MNNLNHALKLGKRKMLELGLRYEWSEKLLTLDYAASFNIYLQTPNYWYFLNPAANNQVISNLANNATLKIYGESGFIEYTDYSTIVQMKGSNEFNGTIRITHSDPNGPETKAFITLPYLEFRPYT